MRKLGLSVAAIVCLIVALSPAGADQGLHSGPVMGQDLPRPLRVLNATGEWAGRYHCPVCEVGLNSGVVIFVRGLPRPGDPLAKVLQGLDAAMETHPGRPSGVAVILVGDGGYKEVLESKLDDKAKVADQRLTKAIVFKEEKVGQLAGIARDAKLNGILFALASFDDLKDYRLDKEADVTVIGYSQRKVLVNRAYAKEQLTGAEADKLSAELKNLPNVGIPKY